MNKEDACEVYSYDEAKVNQIQSTIKDNNFSGVVQLFSALANENRAKIAYALSQSDELCVCDIANIIGSSVATASHHLRNLHKQEIVKYRKEGRLAFYSLDNEHIRKLITITLANQKEVIVNA